MGIKRKSFAAAAATVVLASLAACGGNSSDDNKEPGAESKAGGTLYVTGGIRQPAYLDPQRTYTGVDISWLGRTVYRSLVQAPNSTDAKESATPVPDLATDTGESSDDAKVWKFTLKDGVTWQDGKDITCEDLKYGVSRTFASDIINGGPPYAISWLDIPKETRAAQSLHQAGADVLGQNVDSPATGQYAESKGIPWVGYDSDAHTFAPKQWLTAAVYHWGPYYLRRIKAAMDGSWKPAFYYGSINDGFTSLAPFGPKVSAKTKKAIAAKLKALKNHTFYEFTGPLYDQSGKLRVPKGKKLTLQQLYAMNWLVKGVIGSPKG